MSALIAQITRGVAPAQAIAEAVTYAHAFGAAYQLISGKPAVDAKNAAVDAALHRRMDLVLCEDDVIASAAQWRQLCRNSSDDVLFGEALCRNGELNVYTNPAGEFLYSGTILTRISLAVLRRLSEKSDPVFQCWDCQVINGELHPVVRNPIGHHSDVWFWRTVRLLSPRPRIESIGRVTHIMHPLNRAGHQLAAPCDLEFR